MTISEIIPLGTARRLDGGTRRGGCLGQPRGNPAAGSCLLRWRRLVPVPCACDAGPWRRQCVALLGVSPSLAAEERSAAHDVARQVGVRLVEVMTHEGDRPEYQANGPDRCFHCKEELFSRIDDEIAERYGLDAIAYGENADDARRPDRPGARAATNHHVLRPLADAGMSKLAVRTIARAMGLQVADKPAAPCLASRIPHHQLVTPAKLSQIERAESALRRLGFAELRVRHHDDVARIELPPPDLIRAVSDPLRTQVLAAVRRAGFRFVAVDVGGIQSGAFTLPLLNSDHD